MKNLYRQVLTSFVNVYETRPQNNELKRLENLGGFVVGMIRKGNSNLPDIGSGIPRNIDANSKTTCAERYLKSKWTCIKDHYLPFLKSLLNFIILITPVSQGLRIVIDGSQMGKDHAALMVSLVWQNRGIPICWLVKQGSKGHFTEKNHVEILEQAAEILLPLVPSQMAVTLLGDGEFDGIELQKYCRACCWNYVLRTASSSVFYENGDRFQAKNVEPLAQQNVAFIPDVMFTEKKFNDLNFLCWHDKTKHEDPIFLVTNLEEAGDIIEYYDQRYSIECLFKDLKSTSFNINKTRLKDKGAISNLIMIAALSFIMLTVLAIRYNSMKWRKKVQRVRNDQKVCSFFSFAYKLVQYFMDNALRFNISFQFSKSEQALFSG